METVILLILGRYTHGEMERVILLILGRYTHTWRDTCSHFPSADLVYLFYFLVCFFSEL